MFLQNINVRRYFITFVGHVDEKFLFEQIKADWALLAKKKDKGGNFVGGSLLAHFKGLNCNVLTNRIDHMNTLLLRDGEPRIRVTSIDSHEKPERDYLGNVVRANDTDAMLKFFIDSTQKDEICVLGDEDKLSSNVTFARATSLLWKNKASFWRSEYDKQQVEIVQKTELFEEVKHQAKQDIKVLEERLQKTLTDKALLEAEIQETRKPKRRRVEHKNNGLALSKTQFMEEKKRLEDKLEQLAAKVTAAEQQNQEFSNNIKSLQEDMCNVKKSKFEDSSNACGVPDADLEKYRNRPRSVTEFEVYLRDIKRLTEQLHNEQDEESVSAIMDQLHSAITTLNTLIIDRKARNTMDFKTVFDAVCLLDTKINRMRQSFGTPKHTLRSMYVKSRESINAIEKLLKERRELDEYDLEFFVDYYGDFLASTFDLETD